MNQINASNIDSKFWNIEYLTADILKSIELHGNAVIHFNTEGPAFLETNLHKLFEYLKSIHGIDLSKITIITGNILEETTKGYNVVINPEWMYELNELQKININKTKNIDAKKFGILIGRSNYPRLMLAGNLYSKFKDETFITYHYNSSSDYHKNHLGFEELIHKFGPNDQIVNDSFALIKNSPIIRNTVNIYPIVQPECYKILPWYSNFFIDIVSETYFSGNVFFPTEKTWRAIATKTPFIVQGPDNFLKRLKMLGFKTFDQWWDESYDEDPYDYKLTALARIIGEVAKLDIKKIYLEMESVLEHNYKVFKSLNTQKIKDIIK